jgi:hypothetical protein
MNELEKLRQIWLTSEDEDDAFAFADACGNALPELLAEVKRLGAIETAARDYFTRYCQDEAADDGPEMTGCGQSQHESAKMLRAALRETGQ